MRISREIKGNGPGGGDDPDGCNLSKGIEDIGEVLGCDITVDASDPKCRYGRIRRGRELRTLDAVRRQEEEEGWGRTNHRFHLSQINFCQIIFARDPFVDRLVSIPSLLFLCKQLSDLSGEVTLNTISSPCLQITNQCFHLLLMT